MSSKLLMVAPPPPPALEPPPGRLLKELAGQYLDRRGGDRLRPEPVGAAWEWALRARRATTALMTGSAKTRYDVFDYLVDALQRENTPETFVAESVPRAAADYADGPEAMTIGTTAHSQGHFAAALHASSRDVPHHDGLIFRTLGPSAYMPTGLDARRRYRLGIRS